MVDFSKLKVQQNKPAPIEPQEILRRLPKPAGFNDLYASQADVLNAWFERRGQRDTVVKLHTGGGKTLVGLLMAQSTLNETKEPVLYLAPTRQLVAQTLEKAQAHGIPAVPYGRGQPLAHDFVNGKAVMIATYQALFNGLSLFGIRGAAGAPIKASAVILDDAHAAFAVMREAFTLEVSADTQRARYDALAGLFRRAFIEIERVGSFDDIVKGVHRGVIEVPYWAWFAQLEAVRAQLLSDAAQHPFVWPLLRDNLHLCHALISPDKFSITPILPLVHCFPTFAEAPRRIYMSATIADDSEIVRTFDADPAFVDQALTSRALAGISERMILIPELMPFSFNVREAIRTLLQWTTGTRKLGAIVLVPSNRAAEGWAGIATFADGSEQVERLVQALQARLINGPVVFANRYDGIDLPADSCRLLIMEGLPTGTSDYELFRAATLYGSAAISRMLAQRIEQGIGRGARGSGDHCVVILAGSDLAGWLAKDANFRLLTPATRAQIDMGQKASKEVRGTDELGQTIRMSYDRDSQWTQYHAETLAESVEPDAPEVGRFDVASCERKAFNLWLDGYPDNAVSRLAALVNEAQTLDIQTRGWLLQLAARIASHWQQHERADELQRDAFARNRNLLRPRTLPPYRPLPIPGEQAQSIAARLRGYRIRRGFMHNFNEVVSHLHPTASANQFERSLAELGQLIGLSTERHDRQGIGSDLLWLLPHKIGLIIEAKSRKLAKNPLNKEEHGQLLIAEEWFKQNYPAYQPVRVSVSPSNLATKAAAAT